MYFAYIRDEIAFKTRSPKLITIGFIFLYMDSIGNTVIFASKHDYESWHSTCNTSIIDTVLFFFGILLVYFLRMYRIYRVFSCYN